MRVLFVNPPYVLDGNRAIRPNKAMLPVGPLSISAAIMEKGHKVTFLDLVFVEDWPQALDRTEVESYDMILICCHTARNISCVKSILDHLGSRRHDKCVCIGGNVTVGLGKQDFARLGINATAVVRGYGHELIDQILSREPGDIIGLGVPAALPLPALELIDGPTHQKYLEHSQGRYPIIGPGGFGCQWSCTYCLSKMGPYIPRDLANIEAEAQQAWEYDYRHLWCVDNVVLQDPEITVSFARMCKSLGFEWSGMTRPETVNDLELLEMLKAHGLVELAVGVESMSELQLRLYRRGAKRDGQYHQKIRKAFALINQAGITSNAFVMLDGSEETEDSFWRLYQFLREIKASTVSWSFYNPPPSPGLTLEDYAGYGFYNWPGGHSQIPPERVVQQAMILSGCWWSGWTLLKEDEPFYQEGDEFGVVFDDKLLTQLESSRSPCGDIWEVWEQDTAVALSH